MTKQSKQEMRQSAKAVANDYLRFARERNNAGMTVAASTLFGVVGYWRVPRTMDAGQFRGGRGFPKFARMPSGSRPIRWDADAVAEAWANS